MNEPPEYNEHVTGNWALVLCFAIAGSMFVYAMFAYKTRVKDLDAFQQLSDRVQRLEAANTNKLK
jgi:hypothetical protein